MSYLLNPLLLFYSITAVVENYSIFGSKHIAYNMKLNLILLIGAIALGNHQQQATANRLNGPKEHGGRDLLEDENASRDDGLVLSRATDEPAHGGGYYGCTGACFQEVHPGDCPSTLFDLYTSIYKGCTSFVPVGKLCKSFGECYTDGSIKNCQVFPKIGEKFGVVIGTSVYERIPCGGTTTTTSTVCMDTYWCSAIY